MSPEWAGGHDFGRDLCAALGLDADEVVRIFLDVPAGSIVQIGVVRLLHADEGERVNEVLTHYGLVPLPAELEDSTP